MNIKNLNRIGFISSNALRQIVVSAIGMVIPFMVIHHSSKEVWGEFVSLLLYSLLATQIINWGNKEYLLRKFSETPSKINTDFSSILLTRLPLVLLFLLVGIFFFEVEFVSYLSVWLFGRFLIHSYEVLIVYEKKFNVSLAIELGSFLVFVVAFYSFLTSINVTQLLILFSFYQLVKGICYLLIFKNNLTLKTPFNFDYYKTSIWFFLLSILGFLVSKIDVYIVEQFGNTIMTSDYQIINGLLVFIMAISGFIYAPFTKNMYRNNELVIQKAKKTVSLIGLLIVPISLFFVYEITSNLLNLELNFWFYIVAFFYVFPTFVYGIEIVNLFKQHREKRVLINLSIGVIVNCIASSLFLYLNYGITGTLLGSAIAQLVIMALVKFSLKKESH
jgi:hypothetical protein